jgi:hypothetical protein
VMFRDGDRVRGTLTRMVVTEWRQRCRHKKTSEDKVAVSEVTRKEEPLVLLTGRLSLWHLQFLQKGTTKLCLVRMNREAEHKWIWRRAQADSVMQSLLASRWSFHGNGRLATTDDREGKCPHHRLQQVATVCLNVSCRACARRPDGFSWRGRSWRMIVRVCSLQAAAAGAGGSIAATCASCPVDRAARRFYPGAGASWSRGPTLKHWYRRRPVQLATVACPPVPDRDTICSRREWGFSASFFARGCALNLDLLFVVHQHSSRSTTIMHSWRFLSTNFPKDNSWPFSKKSRSTISTIRIQTSFI